MKCELCEKGYITTSPTYDNPEGGTVTLKFCSNIQCDYNERVVTLSKETKKFIEENMTE